MDLLAENSGPFICECGSSEPTEPPGYGPEIERDFVSIACAFRVIKVFY